MALNKKQTSGWVKGVIVVLIVAFVGLGLASVAGSLSPNRGGSNAGGSSSALDQIAAELKPGIDATEKQLQVTPKDYNLLKALGDQYFDWAGRVAQAAPNAAVDGALWLRSADYYKRALAVKRGDPAVGTDMAIAQFYSGDAQAAIATIELVMKSDPKFPQAPFNAGIFYGQVGQSQKAVAAFQRYLELEPKGANAAQAKSLLAKAQGSAGQPGPGSGSATGSAPASGTP